MLHILWSQELPLSTYYLGRPKLDMTYFAYSSILMSGKRQAMHYKPNQSKEMTQMKFQIQEML